MEVEIPAASGPVPTEPVHLDILELFDLDQIQELQDNFAAATGLASLVVRPDGTPVTRPSRFCRLCSEIIRGTEKGRAACMESDRTIGAPAGDGPMAQRCLSGGLWDAGARITIGGQHVANWLVGQVRTSAEGDAEMLAYAREIGADEVEFASALAEVPMIPEQQFRAIADFLFVMANQLSASAFSVLENERMAEGTQRASVALQESEHRYRQLFERSPVGYQSLDAEGRFIIVNAAWLELLGYSEDDVVGKWFGDFLAAAYRDAFRERFPLFKAAGSIHSEFEMVRKDGTVRFVGFDGVIGHDASGRFEQTHCVLKDITEERRAARALVESEQRFSLALMEAPFPVMLHAEDGEVIQINRAWEEITGYFSADIATIGDWTERAYGERSETLRAHIDDLYVLNHRKDEGEFTIRTKSGNRRVWEFSTTPLGTMADGRRLIMSAAHDVTDRKHDADLLRDSEARFRRLFENVLEGFAYCRVLFDDDGAPCDWVYLETNEAFERVSGIEDAVGRRILELSPDIRVARADLFDACMRVATTGRPEVIDSEGPLGWIHFSLTCPEPDHFVAVGEDITDRKRAESALVASNDRLEGVLRSVTQTMGKVIEARDPYTQGHEQGVARLSALIATEMGLPQDDLDAIEIAALVHDIGKLSVPAEILTKPGQISPTEFALIRGHSQAGYEILKDIDFGWPVADIVLQHHERMDGSGYPGALAGEGIMVLARVIAVADVVDAMASFRPYRPALGIDAAIEEIRNHPEKYDAAASAALLKLHAAGLLGL